MRRPSRADLLFPLAVGLCGALLTLLPPTLELEEDPGLRWLFLLRGPILPPDDVIIVSISADSAETFGISIDTDEWPRALHADLIDRLSTLNAAVILLDIYFENPTDNVNDARLAAAIGQAGNVILLERVSSEPLDLGAGKGISLLEQRFPPLAPLANAALATGPFTLPRVPIRTSQFWTFGRVDTSMPNLPVLAMQARAAPLHAAFKDLLHAALGSAEPLPADISNGGVSTSAVRAIRLLFASETELARRLRDLIDAKVTAPADRRLLHAIVAMYAGESSRYLNYYGPPRTFPTVAFHEVVLGDPDVDFAGKVVFVGYSERRQPEQQDDFLSAYSERSGLNLSGVEIGATAFANLLQGDSIKPLSLSSHALTLLAWGCLLTWLLLRLPIAAVVPAALALGGGYLGHAWYQFAASQLWFPIVMPLLAQLPVAVAVVVYSRYRSMNAQRMRIQTVLGYYVPTGLVARLARESASAEPARQVVRGTCLVTDAEKFTTLSEGLRPEALGELMQAYYQVLTQVVERHGGFVADVSGDSMVAIWTTSLPDAELQRSALAAALDILAEVARFNEQHAAQPLPTGVGLDSGELLLGNIGLSQQYQFRAMGDIVNTASRIEGLNRLLGTGALASAVAICGSPEFCGRKVGSFLLRGKSVPTTVFEVLGSSRHKSRDALFAAALSAFERRDWSEAKRGFSRCLDCAPNDGPSRFYVEQCARYAPRQLPEGWSGTIEITTK